MIHHQQYIIESSSSDDKVLILELEFSANGLRGVYHTGIDAATVDSVHGQYCFDPEEYKLEFEFLENYVDMMFDGRRIDSIQQDANSHVDDLLMKRLMLA